MAITMQGSWTVSVRSAEAFEPPQRFVIAGADTGNGTYDGDPATLPVFVTGSAWSISIQIQQGGTWIDSHDRITFPTTSGGNYYFDIQSNTVTSDPLWDDLVLTCSTPVTLEDYVIYGNVSYYSGFCLFNPCSLPFLTIETESALAQAIQNPLLRVPLEKLYPDRLRIKPPQPPGPQPDPPPFVPLVVPLRDSVSLPTKVGQIFKRSAPAAHATSSKKAAAAAADVTPSFSVAGSFSVGATSSHALGVDRVALASLADRLVLRCSTGPLPGVALRFQEYDRTGAELAGGPYTGTGDRETLGVCATDVNGNYIFRFSRTLAQYLHEAAVDVAPGEDLFTQILPDVIAQLLAFDPGHPAGYSYETAPYWNIPFLRQINICVPQEVAPITSACQGANAIQAIGNIFIGAPQPDGSRVGFSNQLGAEGRITTHSSLPSTPSARCAAWAGLLDFFACFIDHSDVTQYTIRYQPAGDPGWHFFQESYSHPQIALLGVPGYSGTPVGPFPRLLTVDGVPGTPAQAYDNIENDNSFILTHRTRKAWISSWAYPAAHVTAFGTRQYGSVSFWIEGYNAAGARVAGAEDTITLYIDNNGPIFDIASVDMGAQSGGDCALFNLHGALNTPLTVRFRALHPEGFMDGYGLSVRKGNTAGFAVDGARTSGAYVHGDDLLCNSYDGTLDDLTADISGYVQTDLTPHDGPWLLADQPFCTFAIHLGCSIRVTNGYNSAVAGYGPIEYLLGIQAS